MGVICRMSARLVFRPFLLLLLLGQGVDAHDNDGCPQNFRRCNDECLDQHNNHTLPCDQGPWGKCLSPSFPFFCPLTNTCIRKMKYVENSALMEALGLSGMITGLKERKIGEAKSGLKKDNSWELEEGAYDTIWAVSYNIEVTNRLERYN
eukprot:TRINITY_DN13760_c0_g1_i1.p1 TRINITY_DN13760_c0_g1~~TRINITY_DN13760_c0_g1_i1.p1  ORF type:complete len:158 (-),score=36.47 TRINITY_DN13760_c0_g1_i1:42-491(-)